MSHDWRAQAAFADFWDCVHSDSLVVFTGAGISSLLRNGAGAMIPNWPNLLGRLRKRFESDMSDNARAEVDELLDMGFAVEKARSKGREFIEAAEIMEQAVQAQHPHMRPSPFQIALQEEVTPQLGATSESHQAILKLDPRAIVTFNYDDAHESAGATEKAGWQRIVPLYDSDFDEKLGAVIQGRLSEPILLKAHGTIDRTKPGRFVLTWSSYRELLARSPTYRAFFQFLLVNFDFVFVGFSIEDTDFDACLNDLAVSFSAPVRKHFVIRLHEQKSPSDRYLARRHGIETIYVDGYDDIPKLLSDAATTPGHYIEGILARSLDHASLAHRRTAHKELAHLSIPGSRCALDEIRRRIDAPGTNERDLTELVYSIKYLASKLPDVADLLLTQIERALAPASRFSSDMRRELIAHSLEALTGVVQIGHVDCLEKLYELFMAAPPSESLPYPDPDNRIPAYFESLICRARAAVLAHGNPLPPRRFVRT